MNRCVYCNGISQCRDHIARISEQYNGETVNSCLLCNSTLKDYFYSDINARRGYLLSQYEHWMKYRFLKIRAHGREEMERKIAWMNETGIDSER